MNLIRTGNESSSRPAGGKATRKIRLTGTTANMAKSGGMNGRSSKNRYLEANNRPERVDLRSYERQGLDIIPTVHEGAAVRQMEKRGIQTNIGNLNREIKAANSLMKSIRQLIKNLKGWIAELSEKRNELLAQKAAEEAVFLPNLLMKYMEIRKAERSSWTRAGQSRGTSKDLKGSQRSPVLSPEKGTFHRGGFGKLYRNVREICRRLPKADEAKGNPQQRD